jgi:hypothetical protein
VWEKWVEWKERSIMSRLEVAGKVWWLLSKLESCWRILRPSVRFPWNSKPFKAWIHPKPPSPLHHQINRNPFTNSSTFPPDTSESPSPSPSTQN